MRRSQGFTIVEMLVTMVVLAIVVAFAAPSYQNLQRSISIDSNTSRFVNGLSFARAEAATRGSIVTMCKSNDAQNCTNANDDWGVGWLVFEDTNQNAGDAIGVLDAGEEIIRVWNDGVNPDGTLIEQSAVSLLTISFDEEGYLEDQTIRTFHLRINGCGADELQILTVRPLGRVDITQGNC